MNTNKETQALAIESIIKSIEDCDNNDDYTKSSLVLLKAAVAGLYGEDKREGMPTYLEVTSAWTYIKMDGAYTLKM